MIAKDVPHALDPSCFEALKFAIDSENDPTCGLHHLAKAVAVPPQTQSPEQSITPAACTLTR
jgi:hypothetical protein